MAEKRRTYRKPGFFSYLLLRIASFFVSAFVFRRTILRNELRGVKGPCVVIANHEAALDFVNFVGATRRRVTFVISNSFYSSLPLRGIMDRLHVIPKQQFQTETSDLLKMKAVVEGGGILVIYPAGLMCEDGLSTPIPQATYKFLKWMKEDVYAARTTGTYFSMPKWAGGMRAGKTYLDIYKLFDRETLASMPLEEVREKTDGALLFDAYREQERYRVRYRRNDDIRGLENVLYACPHCGREFTMSVTDRSTLRCTECGFAETSDELGFLHKTGGEGEEIRYVSDWSRFVYGRMLERIREDPELTLSSETDIHMIDPEKHRFVPVGEGTVTLYRQGFRLLGKIREKAVELKIPIVSIPILPFSPGKRFELQHGPEIYRCVLKDGRLAQKFIHMLKARYALQNPSDA